MKKWLRRALIAIALIGLTLGILYECTTHVGRGWLRKEAFYDGRPTSWWRERIDQWKDRFFSEDDAFRSLGGWGVMFRPRSSGLWDRIRDGFRSEADLWRDNDPPKVLTGSSDAEPVLRELERDDNYRRFVEQARINAATEWN
jgi:hypothetical protein